MLLLKNLAITWAMGNLTGLMPGIMALLPKDQKTANIADDACTVRKESHFIPQLKQGVSVAHVV